MLEAILVKISAVFAAIPFSTATWIVIAIIGFFIWLFAKAHKNPNSPIAWEHLIVDSETDRASPYKLGYILGLIVATWVVIRLLDADKLSWDIFGGYLMFLLGGAGMNSWTKSNENKAAIQKTGQRPAPPPSPKVDDVIDK